jgi:hypothetical protein
MTFQVGVGVKGPNNAGNSPRKCQKSLKCEQESMQESRGIGELGVKGPKNGGESMCKNQESQLWEQESTQESPVSKVWARIRTRIEGFESPCENQGSWESMQESKVLGIQESMSKSRKGELRVGRESKI